MMKTSNRKPLGIYIHIPFCLSKCRYCGFLSHEGSTAEEQSAYVDSLIDDIREYGKSYGQLYNVDTVFIGGGTPSIIKAEDTVRILSALREEFNITDDAEITIESNPKTLDMDKLIVYRKAGINRLSIGVQSLDDRCLQRLGRVHSVADFEDNFRKARAAGFDNINIDLMFAIPGHTLKTWENTLERAIGLEPEHISFYSLQIEEGTPFYEMFLEGKLVQVPDDTDREMYHLAIKKLKEAGYKHYEISNAAKPGYESRHNMKYWSLDEYLGIGEGASSYMQGVRFAESPVLEYHENTFLDDASEFVFTGLRKTGGIELKEFCRRFGRDIWDVFGDRRQALAEFFEKGLLIEADGRLYLSEEGLDISNSVMAEFV